MRPRLLKPAALATLEALRSRAMEPSEHDHPYAKLSRAPWVPLSVERIHRAARDGIEFELWSLAHYGEQNGDLMADPEMELCRVDRAGEVQWLPVSWRNDYAGFSERCVGLDTYTLAPVTVAPRPYRDAVEFLEMWTTSIREQQGVE